MIVYKLRARLLLLLLTAKRDQLQQTVDHIANELNDSRYEQPQLQRKQLLDDYENKQVEISKLDEQIARATPDVDHDSTVDPEYYSDDDVSYVRTAYTPIGSAINRKLGPLPVNVDASTPTDELIGIRGCMPLLIIAYVGTVFITCVGPFAMPWLFYGGARWLTGGANIDITAFGPLQIMAIAYIALTFLCPAQLQRYICRSSTHHANRYRAGAETWTWKQRVSSNVFSSFDSILLFVLFPFVSLLIISGVSTLLMHAYLLEQRIYGSAHRAKLATIKLHNEYTEGVFFTLAIVVLTPWLFQTIGQ